MKKTLILLILFSFVKINAQFNTNSFDVSLSDLQTNSYIKDSISKSLVIYEEGNSFIHETTFKLITEIKRKIKIFNKDDSDKTTIEIYLYNTDNKNKVEKIRDIKAVTYNLKNNSLFKTTLRKSNIFEEVYNKNYKIVKFTMPKIENGSVITYSYTLESPFIFKYKGWHFQDDIPVLYSEYRTSIPGNYEYSIKLTGFKTLDVKNSKLVRDCLTVGNGGSADCTESRYVMKDIPAFIEEDFTTTKDNYLSRIDYELKVFRGFDGTVDKITKTWKDADVELKFDKNIGKQLQKLSLTKGLLTEATIGISNPLEKAKTIYTYVKKEYTWNDEHKLFKDVSIKSLIKNKSGKASELNILLHNLLKANNIKVKPILLSTRKNGFATKLYPVISDFNYLIVEANIDGKLYLLDATDKYLSFGEIPFKCLNGYGRLLDFKNGSQWVDIKAEKNSTIQHQIKLNLSDEGSFHGYVNSRYLGYHALPKKKSYFSNSLKYLEDFENRHESISVIEHVVKSNGKSDKKFQEYFEIEVNDLNMVNDIIYLDPFIFKFFTKNPFQLQQRTYPIDFGFKDTYMYSIEIDLNSLYQVIETPKDIIVKLPNNSGEFNFATKFNNNKLTLHFKINFKKALYSAQYYDSLKEFMARVVNTQTKTLIILKKK
jgi:Transglutaminase-like superfamily